VAPAVSKEAESPIPTRQCASCGRGCEKGLRLKPCSRCRNVVYCGNECQRAHWKGGHKESCIPID
jgi:hypothetical protein